MLRATDNCDIVDHVSLVILSRRTKSHLLLDWARSKELRSRSRARVDAPASDHASPTAESVSLQRARTWISVWGENVHNLTKGFSRVTFTCGSVRTDLASQSAELPPAEISGTYKGQEQFTWTLPLLVICVRFPTRITACEVLEEQRNRKLTKHAVITSEQTSLGPSTARGNRARHSPTAFPTDWEPGRNIRVSLIWENPRGVILCDVHSYDVAGKEPLIDRPITGGSRFRFTINVGCQEWM